MTSILYRLTASAQTKTTANTEKVEFDVSDAITINRLTASLTRKQTDNGSPGINQARTPDTGFKTGSVTLEVTWHLGSTTPASLTQIRNWVRGEQINEHYPEGQMGFEYDKIPIYNLKPNTDAGYRITDFSASFSPRDYAVLRGTITLTFSGIGSRLGETS